MKVEQGEVQVEQGKVLLGHGKVLAQLLKGQKRMQTELTGLSDSVSGAVESIAASKLQEQVGVKVQQNVQQVNGADREHAVPAHAGRKRRRWQGICAVGGCAATNGRCAVAGSW